jgi:1-acyl-sn-glycerol-3-phosphate acyltransferase
MLVASWRLTRAAMHGLHGVAIVLWRFPSLDEAAQQRRIAWWAAKMLRVLGLQLNVQGRFEPGPKLIVVNHVSWLDIMAVHALHPEARFVSKAEVREWPVVRRLVDSARTLYLERERRRDAFRVVHQVADALRSGDTVALFPEGTTGRGDELLPFHGNLLQAAISTGTPLQPVVLRYADPTTPFTPAAAYLGETTLRQTLWMLARARGLALHVTVLPVHEPGEASRRELAQRLRERMDEVLAPWRDQARGGDRGSG